MHPYQQRLEIIEMMILKEFQDLGFELSEENTMWSAEVAPHKYVHVSELAVQINEALGLPSVGVTFEEFVGQQ